MSIERTAVIIKEIQYWKEHRMLPETYCDFLLVLYSKGEELTGDANLTTEVKQSPAIIISMLISLVLIPFSFLVLYFTEFHPTMQLSILLLFGIYEFWFYLYLIRRKKGEAILPLMGLLLLILLISLTASKFITDHNFILISLVLINFIVWLIIGRIKKIKFLQILSILCIAFSVFYLI